jgi:hypothetical protein
MTFSIGMPHLLLGGEVNREERTRCLFHAFDTMCAVVRVLWPSDYTGQDPEQRHGLTACVAPAPQWELELRFTTELSWSLMICLL